MASAAEKSRRFLLLFRDMEVLMSGLSGCLCMTEAGSHQRETLLMDGRELDCCSLYTCQIVESV